MKATVILLAFGLAASPAFADLIVTRGTLGVEHYTDNGVSLGTLIAPGTGGLSDARGVAVSPSGDTYVADFSNDDILKFSPSGAFQGVFAGGPDVDTPLGIAFGTSGDLFVASAGPVSNITRVNGATGAVISAAFTSGNVNPLGGPQYLTFGPTLAVTDIAGHAFRFDANSGIWISTAFLDNPQGVVFDSAGNRLIVQRISDNVVELPAGGGSSIEIIPNGTFTGSPTDLAFGPGGLLYVASSTAIYRFDLSGGSPVLLDSFGNGGRYIAFTEEVPEPSATCLSAITLAFAALLGRRKLRAGRLHA